MTFRTKILTTIPILYYINFTIVRCHRCCSVLWRWIWWFGLVKNTFVVNDFGITIVLIVVGDCNNGGGGGGDIRVLM